MSRRCLPLFLGVLLLPPPCVVAQDALELRAAMDEGTLIRRVFQVYARVTLEEPSTGTTVTREIARLGGASQYGLSATGEEFSVHLALDSVRVRRRDGTGPWQEYAATPRDSQWVQLTMDGRLRVRRVIRPASLLERGILDQLIVGVPGFVVPDGPVRPGERWGTIVTIPWDAPGVPTDLASERPLLLARSTAVVDSLVARAHDTLAFLSVDGSIEPEAATGPDGARVVYGGQMTGTLVWSSGWRGVVSVAVRYDLVADERRAQGRPSRRLTIETTVRHAVLP